MQAKASGIQQESTYMTRVTTSGFTCEERLQQALSIRGFLTILSGPSQTAKTVLCKKVIGFDHIVEISASDMLDPSVLWMQIGTTAGMPYAGSIKSRQQVKNVIEAPCTLTKESVLTYCQEHDLVLLVNDFHHAPNEMQVHMAQQFKDALRKGLQVIITTSPRHLDDILRANPDLQGRISIIEMQA